MKSRVRAEPIHAFTADKQISKKRLHHNFLREYFSAASQRVVGRAMAGERRLTVLIEKDEDNYYVASVVELPGCHTQARTLDELMKRIREAIELYLETVGEEVPKIEFVGVQIVAI